MSEITRSPNRFRKLARAFALVGVGIVLALMVTDSVLGGLVLLSIIGGGAIAAGLILFRSMHRSAPIASPDAFARRGSQDILNVSQIRVAGLGGLGLVVVALAVGITYPLATAVLSAGVVGGVAGGVAMILYRRQSTSRPDGSAGSAEPSVLGLDGSVRRSSRSPSEEPHGLERHLVLAPTVSIKTA